MGTIILALILMGGGLTFGCVMLVGVMLHSGKWALPGSPQHRLREAQMQTKLAALAEQRSEHHFKVAQTEVNQELLRVQGELKIEQVRDQVFQLQLGRGEDVPSDS